MPERDPMDTALDALCQKIERRMTAKKKYDKARVGSSLDTAARALDHADRELKHAVTNYNDAVRDWVSSEREARFAVTADGRTALASEDCHDRAPA